MIDRCHDPKLTSRVSAAVMLLVLGAGLSGGLSGCADVGDSFASAAFVDPAKYETFDCKQLEAERKTLAVRTAELQGLIAKADTGVGGSVIGELAYRNDYISARASSKLADEMWQRNKCVATLPAAPTPVLAPAPSAQGKGRGSTRSGSAVH
ncbi:twin-arginine translocation pathway signal [uncultured Bradyrhizobium sp.]|uniref:twin-arginine translocation pathway signal n=1 Tax=uncultured Bradyrhizobium sp. TaxID=199684 RepID=UPI0035CBB107